MGLSLKLPGALDARSVVMIFAHTPKGGERDPKHPFKKDMHSEPSNLDFSDSFYESVVAGLRNVIGESPMKAATFLMEFRSTTSPEEFSGRLRRVFGPGSTVLETMVVKELYQRLGLLYSDSTDFDFIACVERAKDTLSARLKGGHD